MIFFLNKGLILEQEIVKALKEYFASLEFEKDYNIALNITNEHPFNTLLGNDTGNISAASLFPSIVVTTSDDSKPAQLDHLVETQAWTLERPDIDKLVEAGYRVAPGVIEKLKVEMDGPPDDPEDTGEEKTKGRDHLYGIAFMINRSDKISIEIWAENIDLKNIIYELTRLYICGFMKEYLEAKLKSLKIFDNSIRGQRSNNFNYEFGIDLAGAQITFDADYIVEQSVIDTELIEINREIIIKEVINHVKSG
ncbi:hypothetical protein FACS189447_03330 [Spirochaetia bacterium]|nr:hypothetical protein FACS189447_03330 [Spirochaetia bacterium]